MSGDNSKQEHPTVFISYSHDSIEHINQVLSLSNRLREYGIDCILDQYETSPAEGWPLWMDRNIRDAKFVLMVCTETYYRRVMLEEEAGIGLGVRWEGKLIYNHIYQAGSLNKKFIPVLFQDGLTEHIPTPLQGVSRYRLDGEVAYENLYRHLTNQPRAEKAELGEIRKLEKRERDSGFPICEIFTSKLPVTSGDLFGRDDELDMLDKLWEMGQCNIVSFVAWGGVGKSALVNKWLNYRMGPDNYRGANSVFGWSFYSQGTRESSQVSGDEFIDEALRFFGDPKPEEGSAWDKGSRLADLIRRQRGLLILDGLEPLQNPPGVDGGRVRDAAVGSLLRGLAVQNAGLCVVSTRVAIDDLKGSPEPAVIEIDLEKLSDEAGAEILKKQGVDGTDDELKQVAGEYGGHALALTLLGSYLKTVHEGDIGKRDEVPRLTDEEEQGGHAKRVMKSYEVWLDGSAELDILYVMGLFDRPAEQEAIEALREEPVIDGLTDRLVELSDAKWKFAVERLRKLQLVGAGDLCVLDCHPLIREYFGEMLKDTRAEAWREGHDRLYEYYKAVPEKDQPDTIEEMVPLYRAVGHGCCAGRYQEVFHEVYLLRIQRGNEYYNVKKLGAIGSDLAVLAVFFEEVWEKPVGELSESGRALVLNNAGSWLRALGRLSEAVGPMKSGLDMLLEQKDWKNADISAGNLSELYLVLGQIKEALEYGGKSVEFSDKSGDKFEKYSNRTILSDALCQSGRVGEAEKLFEEAEQMQKEHSPQYPFLYSVWGFRYCDLLLGQGRYEEVERRAKKFFEWRMDSDSILTIALDHLIWGRAYLQQGQKEGSRDFGKAGEHLTVAVDGLRKAGTLEHLSRGLLARAEYWRLKREFEGSRRDLDEAYGVAVRCGMRLHEVDCYIGYWRLYVDMGEEEKGQEYRVKAKGLIKETGYLRRLEDVKS